MAGLATQRIAFQMANRWPTMGYWSQGSSTVKSDSVTEKLNHDVRRACLTVALYNPRQKPECCRDGMMWVV
jgi:hypothetical protein